MKTFPLMTKAAPPDPPKALPPAELHARILALVEELGEATDVAVWQASKPNYFPWQPFFQALKTLHATGQLQFVMLAPGHWIVRSLAFVAQRKPPATSVPKPRRSAKPSPTKAPAAPPQAVPPAKSRKARSAR